MNAPQSELDRRHFLRLAAAGAVSLAGCNRESSPPAETPADAPMRFPGKIPMRVLNDRPPCLESPWSAFRTDITPNDAFFVRWHLQVIPTTIDTRTWRLKVGGHVDKPIELSLDDLRRMDKDLGRRGQPVLGQLARLFEPHVSGGQWGNGAMGNAGGPAFGLKDVLDKAGIKAGAVDVTFAGLDKGGLPTVPDFVKSLPVDEARKPELILAYEMNGEPLPMLNGFPLRLILPGWYATYWVKALSEINVVTKPVRRVLDEAGVPHPDDAERGRDADRAGQGDGADQPDERAVVFHLAGRGERMLPDGPVELNGIAFDGGSGIKKVEVSADGGKTLDEDARWARITASIRSAAGR